LLRALAVSDSEMCGGNVLQLCSKSAAAV